MSHDDDIETGEQNNKHSKTDIPLNPEKSPLYEALVKGINHSTLFFDNKTPAPNGGLLQHLLTLPDANNRHAEWLSQFKSGITYNEKILGLNKELAESFKTIQELNKKLSDNDNTATSQLSLLSQKDTQIKKLEETITTINNEQKLSLIHHQICSEARDRATRDKSFAELLFKSRPCKAFVLSIDIRRSTELMLKSRSPQHFESFINTFFDKLKNTVISNFGIFDKFTGDGALAFFPEHYSGDDAGLYCIKTAQECHSIFTDHYLNNRNCFDTILKDVGLGIGIDYGESHLSNMNGLTLIGKSVVYACRLSSTDHNTTAINQAAYEMINSKYPDSFSFDDVEIEGKTEGIIVGYRISSKQTIIEPRAPDWDKLTDIFIRDTQDKLSTQP